MISNIAVIAEIGAAPGNTVTGGNVHPSRMIMTPGAVMNMSASMTMIITAVDVISRVRQVSRVHWGDVSLTEIKLCVTKIDKL